MSSSISYEKCPHCGSEDTLVMELNCRTGEDNHFCMACGYSYVFEFKRDEEHNLVRTPVEYPIKDCVLGVRDWNTKELIYKKPLTEIENLSEDTFRDWINYLSSQRKPDDTTPDGSHNIFYMGGETPEQLFYLGNRITTSENPEMITVHKVVIIEESTPGYGIFNISTKQGGGTSSAVAKEATKEELIAEAERLLKEHGDDIRFILVTKYNEETKTLEEIFKYESEPDTQVVMEIPDFEEDEYPETDGEYIGTEDSNLPF